MHYFYNKSFPIPFHRKVHPSSEVQPMPTLTSHTVRSHDPREERRPRHAMPRKRNHSIQPLPISLSIEHEAKPAAFPSNKSTPPTHALQEIPLVKLKVPYPSVRSRREQKRRHLNTSLHPTTHRAKTFYPSSFLSPLELQLQGNIVSL